MLLKVLFSRPQRISSTMFTSTQCIGVHIYILHLVDRVYTVTWFEWAPNGFKFDKQSNCTCSGMPVLMYWY